MAEDSGSKTEKATPKKRRDQRKEGNVFQSKDVVTVATLFGSFFILWMMFPYIYESLRAFMVYFIDISGTQSDVDKSMATEFALTAAKTMLPLLLVSIVLAVLATKEPSAEVQPP